MVVVIIHESWEFLLQFPREVIILKFDDILDRSMITFGLSLGHRVIRGSPRMSYALFFQIDFQLSRKVTRTIIAWQSWPVFDLDTVQSSIANGFILFWRTILHKSMCSKSDSFRLFLGTRFFRAISATSCFKCPFSFLRSSTSGELAYRVVPPARRFLPTSRKSLLQR